MQHRTTGRILRCFVFPAAVLSLLVVTPAVACSVPVFRYALERWRTSPYEVVVFHKGSLSDEERKLIDNLSSDGLAGRKFANVTLRLVDLAAKSENNESPKEQDDLQKLWETQQSKSLPWMVVRYPRPMPPVWSGVLNKSNVERLLDSPVRREIARRILNGESAVWVMLESGDSKKDAAAYSTLYTQLTLAPSQIKLPEIDEEDIENGLINIDPDALRVAFSIVKLNRDDPAEAIFVEMLLGSEGSGENSLRDPKFAKQPMAFPVFGRGRVLYALVGDGILQTENIIDTCKELTGPCTCEVKDQNPGVDLLMSVDWDQLVEVHIDVDKELPPLAGLGSFAKEPDPLETELALAEANPAAVGKSADLKPGNSSAAEKPTENTAPQASSDAESTGMSAVLRNTLFLVGFCAVSVVGVSLFLVVRKSS